MASSVIERKTLSVPQAAVMLGIGKTYAYALANKGELPGGLKIGGRFVVSRRKLEAYIDGETGTEPLDAA